MLFKNQKSAVVEFVAIPEALAGIFWVASVLGKPDSSRNGSPAHCH